MRLSCLIFLVVISVLIVTECKPFSEGVEKAPRVDYEQRNLRRKRCLSSFLRKLFYGETQTQINIGNGEHKMDGVQFNGDNNVYIGSGAITNNYVYNGYKPNI